MRFEFQVFFLILLVFMWLVSAWTSLVKFSGGKLRRLELTNKKMFRKAEEWLENKEAYELVFRFLCFFMLAILGTLSYSILEKIRSGWPFYQISLVAGALTFIIVAAGEFIIRLLTNKFEVHLLYVTMPLIKLFRSTILLPLVFMLEKLDSKMEKQEREESAHATVSAEDEILSLVESDGESENGLGALEEDEKRMIKGIFEIDKMSVREIMTPRVDIVALPVTATISEAKKLFVESGHSRIPVYKNNVDNISGVILAKDFLDEERIAKCSKVEEMSHKPVFIPETKAVNDLLAELKRTRNHLAVVIDEYGGTAGIITLEDIIEEIIGEVQDEYDEPESTAKALEEEADEDSGIFLGRTLISDVNEKMDLDIPDTSDADTIGGYVCSEIGRIPETGEELKLQKDLTVTILKADKRKIIKLKIERQKQ